MQSVLNPEDEVLIATIILQKNWDVIPTKNEFIEALQEASTTLDEVNRVSVKKLISKVKGTDYNILKDELNFVLSYPI